MGGKFQADEWNGITPHLRTRGLQAALKDRQTQPPLAVSGRVKPQSAQRPLPGNATDRHRTSRSRKFMLGNRNPASARFGWYLLTF